MDKKGQWYTDKNGNHYFVEDGQSPKEGWEASKRRKMISGGKYMTSEDGNDYREVSKDEYDNYESDETSFDENNDDDFGFDEEDDYTETIRNMEEDNVDLEDPREVLQYLGANMGLDREDQVRFMERMGYTVDDIEKLRNPDDEEYNTEMKKAQEENAEESVAAEEEQETYSDDDLGYRKNDKGGFDILVKETEDRDEKLLKSVNSRDEARQYIRSLLGKDKNVSDYKEFSSDSEARKYFDEHANELPDGSALYGNKIYLGEDKNKGNPYDPEKLPDEGMSQEELDNKEKLAKAEEAEKIIEEAGMKNVDLTAAHRLKNDYVDGKITKEELVEKYREAFKNSKDIVGENKPQRSFKDMQVLRFMYGTDKSDEELMNKSDEELQEARDYRDYSFTNLLPDEKAAKLEKENEAFNRGETVWDRKRGFPWKKTKMASGILYEGPKGQRVMEDYKERSEEQEEEKPYNREEKVKEYLKEQGFDDDYINKTLENMKKNMNIGQFWDRFFKDKEEK